ncbi:MAG: hypothetical protein ABSB52_07220 [Acidimicrobiales bacterium]|jgi:hypothetical protein
MIRSRYRVIAGAFAGALTVASASGLSTIANLRHVSGASSSVTAEAKAINMKVQDLSASIKWAVEQSSATPKGEAAIAKQAVACLAKTGPVSPDPFGASGVTGGVVLVDVSSPTYYEKSATLTHLPSADSEVVFQKTASGALADLAAVGHKPSLVCLGDQLAADSSLQGAGKGVKAKGSFLPAPRYGGGSGGLHIRFLESGGNLPAGLDIYDDEYFYVEGQAEVSLTFINLGSAFNSSWAASTISKVMARAKSELG